MKAATKLLTLIRAWTLVFITCLVLSGATAIPLESELNWLVNWTGAERMVLTPTPDWPVWLIQVRDALQDTNSKYPFLAYGTDWLAFGHFVIAIAFVGPLLDPVRNRWLIDFGLIACALVLPYALIFGELRGIPISWRCIDCSFGLFGALPLFLCRRAVIKLERIQNENQACESACASNVELNPKP